MIHPKELMIGNRVRFVNEMKPYGNLMMGNDPGGPMQVVYATVDRIEYYTGKPILGGEVRGKIGLQDFLGYVDPERLCGIEIFPKMICEKFGFGPPCGTCYSHKDCDDFCVVWFYNGTFELRGRDYRTIKTGIKYLHQLQNIYYLLTGIEICKPE